MVTAPPSRRCSRTQCHPTPSALGPAIIVCLRWRDGQHRTRPQVYCCGPPEIPAMNAPTSKPVFAWEDPLLVEAQLTDEERMVRDSARAYAQDRLMPRVVEANRHERFD